jgi:predicted regulator of Ras-like GTPase activity (Roadblock/LC7/MglB family)
MDASQALADLTEISSQIEAAVLFDDAGAVLGSTLADGAAAEELVRAATSLLAGSGEFRSGDGEVSQLEASTQDGSVFVVRDGGRGVVATTAPDPTVGLVFYDLKSCLRGSGEAEAGAEAEAEKPKRRRRTPAKDAEEQNDET